MKIDMKYTGVTYDIFDLEKKDMESIVRALEYMERETSRFSLGYKKEGTLSEKIRSLM